MRLLIVPLLSVVLATVEAHNYVVTPIYEYRGPAAPLSSDGRVIDTPEVAQARAAHLALHQKALARMRQEQSQDAGMMRPRMPPMMMMRQQRERTFAPVGQNGRVVDTPEVAQAKAAHMAARTRAAAKTAQYDLDGYNARQSLIYVAPVRVAYTQVLPIVRYHGPPAPLGPDGRVVDTPEVVRAREAHMKAHARAVALMSQMHGDYD